MTSPPPPLPAPSGAEGFRGSLVICSWAGGGGGSGASAPRAAGHCRLFPDLLSFSLPLSSPLPALSRIYFLPSSSPMRVAARAAPWLPPAPPACLPACLQATTLPARPGPALHPHLTTMSATSLSSLQLVTKLGVRSKRGRPPFSPSPTLRGFTSCLFHIPDRDVCTLKRAHPQSSHRGRKAYPLSFDIADTPFMR